MANSTTGQALGVGSEVEFKRTFDAPRELVWRVWTEAEHVAKWWGPKGFTNPVCEWVASPGNTIRVDMTPPGGPSNPMGGTFHEVVPPERLVFTSTAFPDAEGNNMIEVLNTVTLVENGDKTEMTLVAKVKHVAPEMLEAIGGMNQGWNESLDRLAEVIGKLSI